MGMITFFGWLLGRPGVARDDSVHSTLRFMELDFVKLAKRLQLESEGRRRGALDQPAPDEAGLDDLEQKIITTIDAEKKETRNSTRLNSSHSCTHRMQSPASKTK